MTQELKTQIIELSRGCSKWSFLSYMFPFCLAQHHEPTEFARMSVEYPWDRKIEEPIESVDLELDPETWLRLQGTINGMFAKRGFPTTVNPEQFPMTIDSDMFPMTIDSEMFPMTIEDMFPATVNPEQYPLTVGGYPVDEIGPKAYEGPAWWSQIEEWTPEAIKKLQEKYKDDKVD